MLNVTSIPLERQVSYRYLWLVSLAAIIIVLGLTLFYTLEERKVHIAQAEYRIQNLADYIISDVDHILAGIDNVFLGINELIDRGDQLDDFDAELEASLDAWHRANPFFMDLLVVDPQGAISHWTGSGEPPNVLDREYVTYHLDHPGNRETFIGRPKLSKVHYGKWFFGMSRPFYNSDGGLSHILVAIIEIESLYRNLHSTSLEEGATIVLLNLLGDIYLRAPGHERFVGRQINNYADFRPDREGRMRVRIESPLDGKERLIHLKQSSLYPVVVANSITVDETLQQWRRDAMVSFGAALLSLSVLLVLFYQLFRQQRHLLEVSTHDGMTRLFNRSGFMALAEREFVRAVRYKLPLSLVMADIDGFKQVNDSYGHKVGDEVLRAVAGALEESRRGSDIVARFGGEEFMVMLVNTGHEDAIRVAEKFRVAVESCHATEGAISVTISLGVTEFDPTDIGLDEMLRRADQALYHSKQLGKNRVSTELANPLHGD